MLQRERRHRMRAKTPPHWPFDVATGATPRRMRAEQRLQERSRDLHVRSPSASDLRCDAEEAEACLPSTEKTKKRKQPRRHVHHTADGKAP